MYTLKVISLQKTRAIHGTVLLEVGKGSDIVAKEDNLVSLADRTTEEQREIARLGGIASGEARRKKATMLSVLEKTLDEVPKSQKNNPNGLSYREMVTLGLIKGAINGSGNNYKIISDLVEEQERNADKEQLNVLLPAKDISCSFVDLNRSIDDMISPWDTNY